MANLEREYNQIKKIDFSKDYLQKINHKIALKTENSVL